MISLIAAIRSWWEKRSNPDDIVAEGERNMNEPGWLQIARKYNGVKEAPGSANNKIILSWADRFGGWVQRFYVSDSIPWCGLFVGNVMLEYGTPKSDIPSNPLGARNWALFGRTLKGPRLGCILVFSRTGGGHVGFYIGEDKTHYHVFGGNQKDQVNTMRIEKTRLISMNWPKNVSLPPAKPVPLNPNGTPTSVNEG